MKHVVFDIGGVLVNWNPALAWSDELGEDGARDFLDRTAFASLNLACDAGATFTQAAAELSDPEDAARLAKYVDHYVKTVPSKIQESWDILYQLKAAGIRLFAITNWSAETWPEGLKVHPELAEVFEMTIVSGQVGMIKPSTAIYKYLCDKAQIHPQDCIFTDDALHNCIGARAAGMDAIHFTSADALAKGLKARGLL